MRYFQDDPKIIWDRVLCPYCKKPTGHDTNCEQLGEEAMVPFNKVMALPIFSVNCFFKNEQIWKADVNYPVSQLFIEHILTQNIRGLDKIAPIKSHSFQISVSRLNDAKKIVKQVTTIYKNFIKEMQAKELDLHSVDYNVQGIIGIKFPNGQTYCYDSADMTLEQIVSQEKSIMDIFQSYPGSKLIYNKGE